MNVATAFLSAHWQELGLSRVTSPERLSWIVLTPNFPASSHVLFFVLCEGTSDPVLVMKISRVPGEDPSLSREAANLRAVHAATGDGFNSIPRMIAFEHKNGNAILIETALVGVSMDPAFVRRRTKWSVETVLDWVTNLHRATAISSSKSPEWFARLVDAPLDRIRSAVRLSAEEKDLLDNVRGIAENLRDASLPLVFSHGDLSDPNLLVLRKGGVGVVDWEMAEPESLPGADLFFFLNYIATVRRPWTRADDVASFKAAFFSRESWARAYIARYCEKTGLSAEFLTPLFVLGFTRYLAGLVARLQGLGGSLDSETSAWLRTDRAYILWREAVRSASQLVLS